MSNALQPRTLRLGVNIDHVATIRNARGGDHPDPVRAAEIVAAVGGDGITAHLREDRRHIRDEDLARIQAATNLPLNLEMAATREMLAIALRYKPHAACIVPEKREERTTEGGLDAAGLHNTLVPIVEELRARARDALLTEALAVEETLEEHKPADDLLSLPGMDEATAYALSSRGIATRDDLAEMAVDEIADIEGVDEARAATLIMEARKHWFT